MRTCWFQSDVGMRRKDRMRSHGGIGLDRMGPTWSGPWSRRIVFVMVVWGAALCAACSRVRPEAAAPVSGGPHCRLEADGVPFDLFAPGRLFTLFARDRAAMLLYLFNADSLWPKTADLCARGRNALLDLELGPGTSYELGLWGPAWDAPIYSVAVTNPFIDGRVTGSRFLATWPLVADGQTEWLRQAAELAVLARRLVVRTGGQTGKHVGAGGPDSTATKGPVPWARLDFLARATGLGRFRFFLCRMPPSLLQYSSLAGLGRAFRRAGHCSGTKGLRRWDGIALRVAVEWGRRLTGALAHRLLQTPSGRVAAGLSSKASRESRARFVRRLLAGNAGALRLARDWTETTEALARRAGVLFASRQYRRFRREHLTVCLPGQGCGLGLTAVEAILDRARIQGKAGLARQAQRAARRLTFLLFGRDAGLSKAQRKALAGERRAYLAIQDRVESDRRRLGLLARRWFAQTGAQLLSKRLRRPGNLLLSSSFYYQTEHLEQTRAGFTHAALIEKLGRVSGLGSVAWQLDRVLGYFYVYPVSRLTHSVTVELLEPAAGIVRRPRRYQWVRLVVPARFRFGSGAVTDKVTIPNLLSYLVEQLRFCPRYYSLPGFFYAAASWLATDPHNARLLEGAWEERTYRGGRYRTLSQRGMEALKGKTILVPVGLLPGLGRRRDHRLR